MAENAANAEEIANYTATKTVHKHEPITLKI